MVDIDSDTVAALRAYRANRGLLSLELVRDTALVLGGLDGISWCPRGETLHTHTAVALAAMSVECLA